MEQELFSISLHLFPNRFSLLLINKGTDKGKRRKICKLFLHFLKSLIYKISNKEVYTIMLDLFKKKQPPKPPFSLKEDFLEE